MITWFLEGFIATDQVTRRLVMDCFPFSVGRGQENSLIIRSREVSRSHALFKSDGNHLVLEDLQSTNGTFVNRRRISADAPVSHGDIIRFGNVAYRLIGKADLNKVPEYADPEATFLSTKPFDPTVVPEGLIRLKTLLDQDMVTAVFQPIVAGNGVVVAHELLGRGTHPNLPTAPVALLKLAESLDLERELSESFRNNGIRLAMAKGHRGPFFVNTHPSELLDTERLFQSTQQLRMQYPHLKLTLEIHEQAVSDIQIMRRLMEKLRALDIGIAFDDFGAGQSRLVELVEATPDIVKFDICLIRDIDRAPEARLNMLRLLLEMCHSMNIKALAEGVATQEEAKVCIQLKFDYLQGFHFSVPKPIEEIGIM